MSDVCWFWFRAPKEKKIPKNITKIWEKRNFVSAGMKQQQSYDKISTSPDWKMMANIESCGMENVLCARYICKSHERKCLQNLHEWMNEWIMTYTRRQRQWRWKRWRTLPSSLKFRSHMDDEEKRAKFAIVKSKFVKICWNNTKILRKKKKKSEREKERVRDGKGETWRETF